MKHFADNNQTSFHKSDERAGKRFKRPLNYVLMAMVAGAMVFGGTSLSTAQNAFGATRPGGPGHGDPGSMMQGAPGQSGHGSSQSQGQDQGGFGASHQGNTNTTDADKVTKEVSPAASGATVLVYMNGSDLESYSGEASTDIREMLESNIGKNVNVIIQTMGTSQWQAYGIASDHAQRYRVNQGKLELVDDSLGQLDTTSADTLSDFISWGTKNYPADRYMLVFWNHGAGPVYGFGYDEFQDDYAALTLDEMQTALKNNSNVHFDFIGMDCCLMSSLETCKVFAPYCDYTILSEDFEPGVGWSYTNWMKKFEENPSMDVKELGKVIVDDMISATSADPENGDATLAVIDEKAIVGLYKAWTDFAYENKDALLKTNYSQETSWRTRPGKPGGMGSHNSWSNQEGFGGFGNEGGNGNGYGAEGSNGYESEGYGFDDWNDLFDMWDSDMSNVTMSDYYVTDILDVASSVNSNTTNALKSAMEKAIVYFGQTSGEQGMNGMGITLPYGDAEFYDQLVDVFGKCGIDKNYIDWLEDFVNVPGATTGEEGQATNNVHGQNNGFDQNDGYYDDYDYDYDGYDTNQLNGFVNGFMDLFNKEIAA